LAIGRREWIEAALAALAREGVAGIRVESLARKLKVTKGSFYWHFKDRMDLLDSVLAEWETETDRLMDAARQERGARARLDRFVQLARETEGRISEPAIFMWARQDAKVARRVKRVEQARVRFLADILEAMGFSPEDAGLRAELAYVAYVGLADRKARDPDWDERRAQLFEAMVSVFLEVPSGIRHAAQMPD
jgi:AcrR family transcriptional regulator